MIVHFRGSVRKILITLILRWLGIRKFSLSEGIRTSAQHYFSSRVTANYFPSSISDSLTCYDGGRPVGVH